MRCASCAISTARNAQLSRNNASWAGARLTSGISGEWPYAGAGGPSASALEFDPVEVGDAVFGPGPDETELARTRSRVGAEFGSAFLPRRPIAGLGGSERPNGRTGRITHVGLEFPPARVRTLGVEEPQGMNAGQAHVVEAEPIATLEVPDGGVLIL